MTEYTLIFNKLNRIEFMRCSALSAEAAIDKLLNLMPGVKIIEVRSEKPDVSTIIFINNVIKVDFKNRRRVA